MRCLCDGMSLASSIGSGLGASTYHGSAGIGDALSVHGFAADEGRGIHDATVANDETVLNQILVLKPRSGYRNSAATSD